MEAAEKSAAFFCLFGRMGNEGILVEFDRIEYLSDRLRLMSEKSKGDATPVRHSS